MKALILSLTLLAATSMSAQDAVQRSFHPNGEVSEVRYPSGDRILFVRYFENGQVSERGAFANGKPDGIWKRFDENGGLVAKVRFENGVREGRCRYTSLDGQTSYRVNYENGRLVHGEQYDAAGALVAEKDNR
jgi:antitoxin component YwqK of YwqJK toxin-antitoxin module